MALWWGGQPLRKWGGFTEPGPCLPQPSCWAGSQDISPGIPLPPHPVCEFLSKRATLTESSSTLPEREERQALGSFLSPMLPALLCLSRLWSVPMTGCFLVSQEAQPRTCGCTWGGQGKASLGLPPWPLAWDAIGHVPTSGKTRGSGPPHSPALSLWQHPQKHSQTSLPSIQYTVRLLG